MDLRIVYAAVQSLGSASALDVADLINAAPEDVLEVITANLDVANAAFIRSQAIGMFEVNPEYIEPVPSDANVTSAFADVLCGQVACVNEVTVALDDSGITKAQFIRGISNLEAFLNASACQEFRNKLVARGVSSAEADAYFQSMVDLATGAKAVVAVYGKEGA